MKKPKNLAQRKADDVMKPLKGVKFDPFGQVEERGWAIVRDLSGREHLTFDWRLQWDNPEWRKQQLVELHLGNKKMVVSRQELEKVLRHV